MILIIGIVGASILNVSANDSEQSTSTAPSDPEPADLGCPPGTEYRRVNESGDIDESGEEVCWQLPPEPRCPEGQYLANAQYNTDAGWTEIIPGTGECKPKNTSSSDCQPGQITKGEGGACVDLCEAEEGDDNTYVLIGNRCVSAESLSAEEAELLRQVLREYYGEELGAE